MPPTDEHGLEVLKKSGEQVIAGERGNHYIKVGGLPTGASGTINPVPVELSQSARQAEIFNITLSSANTEFSQALPSNTRKFILKTRGSSILKFSFVSGESGTKFITLKPGAVYTDDNLYASETIYFQSPTSGDVVEIIAYNNA
jgi:hypothetical protein